MKKSVIITIVVIYIIAIFVVGFIGMEIEVANELIPVENIICVTEGAKKSTSQDAGYDYVINKNYVEGLKIELKCQITPDNATQKKLEYIGEGFSYSLKVNDDGTATVEFFRGGSATIRVKATDNNGVSIIIKINVREI